MIGVKNRLILIISLVLLIAEIFSSCSPQTKEIPLSQIAPVTRGDLIMTISADGYLEMPEEADLKFGTFGRVQDIYVKKGDFVRAGKLLCSLENTNQKLAVETAQYNLELAINNVIQTSCGPRYPTFYTMATALLRFEQAQTEIAQAKDYLAAEKYYDAASSLSLSLYDLTAARTTYNDYRINTLENQYTDYLQPILPSPDYAPVVSALDERIAELETIQNTVERGDYAAALQDIESLLASLEVTHSVVKNNSRLPGAFTYPDTSTSIAISRQALTSLTELKSILSQNDIDRVKAAEKIQMAQHEILMSAMILDQRETIYRAGLNPQMLRAYNLNIDNAMVSLEKAKRDLLNTEIFAPFDGIVVDVPIKRNDQLSTFDYAAKTAIHLVDTSTIRVTGTIDETDIPVVKVGQEVLLSVDALPERILKGHVTFVSPFGRIKSGVVNFPVEIYLDPTEDYTDLRGGLTATADIIVADLKNVIQVPTEAIKGLPGDYYVEVILDPAKNQTIKRTVQIGVQSKADSEIISGLSEGERVLIPAR
jgi:HlyD family secretion protein